MKRRAALLAALFGYVAPLACASNDEADPPLEPGAGDSAPIDGGGGALADGGDAPPVRERCTPEVLCRFDFVGTSFYGVWGSSADDVWAVGSRGRIVHWDGAAWVDTPSGTKTSLRAVNGRSANDVWAVGGGVTRTDGFRDGGGATWTAIPWKFPDVVPATAIAHLDDARWLGFPGMSTFNPDNGSVRELVVDPEDGTAITEGFVPAPSLGLWRTASGALWGVGYQGEIARVFGPDGGARIETNSGTRVELDGIWGDDDDDLWAVGGVGTLLRYTVSPPNRERTWQSIATGTRANLYSVYGRSTNDVWIAGEGVVLHFDGDTVARVTIPEGLEQTTFFGVWASKGGAVVIVGSNVILQYGGQ